MTWIVLDLFGEEQITVDTDDETKKEVKLEPLEYQKDHQLQKQVINIHGEVVTI